MLPYWALLLRLLLAAVLGSAIGFERERLLWAAGLRTHMLVCVGSCLLMIVSAFGFADVLGGAHVILDPSRVAAQVVSGIGFLGAGSILLRGEVVRGLTTAASLWAVAAVGLAVGGGLYSAAATATVIILIILAGIKPIEERYRDSRQTLEVELQADHGEVSVASLEQAFPGRRLRIKQLVVRQEEAGAKDQVILTLSRVSARDSKEIIEGLRRLPGVSDVAERRL